MRQRDDMTFPAEEYVARLQALRDRMAERRLDAVIISDPENLMYLTDYQTTGYSYFQALVVPIDDEPFMVTRAMEESNVHARTWVERTRPYADTGDAIQMLFSALVEFGLHTKSIGYERNSYFFPAYQQDRMIHALADGDLDLDAAAATVAPGAGGLLFLPYLMGERSPWWNPQARGAFVGLAMPHDKPQMARAVLEGVAFGLRQILDSLREHVPDIDALRLIGGGGKSRLWPQILADVFGLPIHMLELKGEATSWGAAVAAGVGAGIYDWSIAAERSQVVAVVEPNPANRQRYDELLNLFTESYLALAPVYARLARIGE